jgi:hypothetical protein
MLCEIAPEMTGKNSVFKRPKTQNFAKNISKNGKNGKNPLLKTKILKLLHGPIFTIWAQRGWQDKT